MRLAAAHRDGAELASDVPHRVGPSVDDGLDLLGAGVGGEVPVLPDPAHQRVTDRAADDGQLMTALGEPSAEVDERRLGADQPVESLPLLGGEGGGVDTTTHSNAGVSGLT